MANTNNGPELGTKYHSHLYGRNVKTQSFVNLEDSNSTSELKIGSWWVTPYAITVIGARFIAEAACTGSGASILRILQGTRTIDGVSPDDGTAARSIATLTGTLVTYTAGLVTALTLNTTASELDIAKDTKIRAWFKGLAGGTVLLSSQSVFQLEYVIQDA